MSKIILTSPEELRAIVSEEVQKVLPQQSDPKNQPDSITLDTAIELLNEHGYPTSKAKIYKLTSSKKMPFRKYGNKLVFSRKELLQWAETQAKKVADSESVLLHIARNARKKL